jgi:hypothetical protein
MALADIGGSGYTTLMIYRVGNQAFPAYSPFYVRGKVICEIV